jgi:hypothetical protein
VVAKRAERIIEPGDIVFHRRRAGRATDTLGHRVISAYPLPHYSFSSQQITVSPVRNDLPRRSAPVNKVPLITLLTEVKRQFGFHKILCSRKLDVPERFKGQSKRGLLISREI